MSKEKQESNFTKRTAVNGRLEIISGLYGTQFVRFTSPLVPEDFNVKVRESSHNADTATAIGPNRHGRHSRWVKVTATASLVGKLGEEIAALSKADSDRRFAGHAMITMESQAIFETVKFTGCRGEQDKQAKIDRAWMKVRSESENLRNEAVKTLTERINNWLQSMQNEFEDKATQALCENVSEDFFRSHSGDYEALMSEKQDDIKAVNEARNRLHETKLKIQAEKCDCVAASMADIGQIENWPEGLEARIRAKLEKREAYKPHELGLL